MRVEVSMIRLTNAECVHLIAAWSDHWESVSSVLFCLRFDMRRKSRKMVQRSDGRWLEVESASM